MCDDISWPKELQTSFHYNELNANDNNNSDGWSKVFDYNYNDGTLKLELELGYANNSDNIVIQAMMVTFTSEDGECDIFVQLTCPRDNFFVVYPPTNEGWGTPVELNITGIEPRSSDADCPDECAYVESVHFKQGRRRKNYSYSEYNCFTMNDGSPVCFELLTANSRGGKRKTRKAKKSSKKSTRKH